MGGKGIGRGVSTEGAVVATCTVTLVAELLTVNEFGETVQEASEGAPAQVKDTFASKPPRPATLNV
jgi:hypothetical protein